MLELHVHVHKTNAIKLTILHFYLYRKFQQKRRREEVDKNFRSTISLTHKCLGEAKRSLTLSQSRKSRCRFYAPAAKYGIPGSILYRHVCSAKKPTLHRLRAYSTYDFVDISKYKLLIGFELCSITLR